MRKALHQNQKDHQEALNKLDATIKANMENSASLGESADRLTRALTGDVKIQGNFGELKLKQLLEDLGLKDGEQYSSQTHLRDKFGNLIKDDEGKGLIPDFILHFPNNREVIVDSKMSFTAYERYVNSENEEERMENIRTYLHQSALTAKPGMRSKSQVFEAWKKLGYTDDPAKVNMNAIDNLTYEDIKAFYEKNVKGKPVTIVIIGDPKTINLKAIQAKWGKVTKVSPSKLFKGGL